MRSSILGGMLLFVAGCTDQPAGVEDSGPVSFTVVSGGDQVGLSYTQLPEPLVVRAELDGKPYKGQVVNFVVTEGGGSVFAGAALTNEKGLAQDFWTLGGPGSQEVQVRAVDSQTGEQLVFATFAAVAFDPVAITATSLTDGVIGTGYSQTLSATGGDGSYAWSISTGTLPAGLSLDASAGVISGTPTTGGTSNFTVQVTSGDGQTATKDLTITIALGQLLFQRYGDIYRIDADGRNEINLTGSRSRDESPQWSPDGSLIAFNRVEDGVAGIYVMNADGTNQRRVTGGGGIGTWPPWSPDGLRLIFGYRTSGNNDDIYVVNVDGSNLTRLTFREELDQSPVFSPNGLRVAFKCERAEAGRTMEICVMNAGGSDPAFLTDNTFHDAHPLWSPDGAQVIFTGSNPPDLVDVYVVNPDGGGLRNLTLEDDGDDPQWSPDGTKILFYSYRSFFPSGSIYVMEADGAAPRRLTTPPNQDIDSMSRWSNDGSQIVFVRHVFVGGARQSYTIHVMHADGTNPVPIAVGLLPVWRPGAGNE